MKQELSHFEMNKEYCLFIDDVKADAKLHVAEKKNGLLYTSAGTFYEDTLKHVADSQMRLVKNVPEKNPRIEREAVL